MFNKRLREMRIQRHYTQQQMADFIDVALRSYQKYEQGEREPSFATLVQLADIFDISTDYLLGRDDFIKSHAKFVDEQQANLPDYPIL